MYYALASSRLNIGRLLVPPRGRLSREIFSIPSLAFLISRIKLLGVDLVGLLGPLVSIT